MQIHIYSQNALLRQDLLLKKFVRLCHTVYADMLSFSADLQITPLAIGWAKVQVYPSFLDPRLRL